MAATLAAEFEFYLEHQDELVDEYDGRFVVIKANVVLGDFDDELAALTATEKDHSPGSFLIQKVSRGDDDFTQIFHSRVGSS